MSDSAPNSSAFIFVSSLVHAMSSAAFSVRYDKETKRLHRISHACAAVSEEYGEVLGHSAPRLCGYYLGKALRYTFALPALVVQLCSKQDQEIINARKRAEFAQNLQLLPAMDVDTYLAEQIKVREPRHLGHEVAVRMIGMAMGVSMLFGPAIRHALVAKNDKAHHNNTTTAFHAQADEMKLMSRQSAQPIQSARPAAICLP